MAGKEIEKNYYVVTSLYNSDVATVKMAADATLMTSDSFLQS